ncbi:hypothetical protein F7731_00300 [Cytobacillus depressus]|uniref:Membrane protein YkvI n=1 Tax=Cytobacillus depressus TaxID=1602942 RepID=A0A6L3VAG0_9BACI|nr:hypothetical protein [Cytobacillus depressus]KAB2338059.1 hypothetical protein F7731_00300 [Cytobacillus depressus]
MKKSIQMAGAYIGTVIGAGFASGQEVLQFFTSFGWLGFFGAILATLLFAFLGMNIIQIGSRLQTDSHKDVVYNICGKYLGLAVDFIITFFLFGVAVIMFAGAGSTFEQQFGIPSAVGSLIMVLLTIATCFFNVEKVLNIIGSITPALLVLVLLIAAYALFTMDTTFAELNKLAHGQQSAASNWFLSGLLYVSFNITCAIPMLAVMGGTTKNRKVAGMGGILGGIGLGLMLILINVGMYTRLDAVGSLDIPMLYLANEISPVVGIFMSIVLLAMIFNTAVGMLYGFAVRVMKPGTMKFKGLVTALGFAGFAASFVGFTKLVGTLYPITGYLGFALIAAVIVAWVRGKRKSNHEQLETKAS